VTIRTWGGVRRIEAILYRWPNGRPLPFGICVALRTLFYVTAAGILMYLLCALPGIGELAGAVLKPIPRYAVAVAAGVLAARSRVDGRTMHTLAVDYVEYRSRARLTAARERVSYGTAP
jgi:hypothetical protein